MTKVAILWHMHQPFYQDLLTGEHVLPWVRLHALKDYYGMVALLREFPEVRVTFNLVPSLLVQLEAFASDTAHERWLEVGLKPADTLTEDERQFLIAEGFHVPRVRMIDPYPRYAELLARRDQSASAQPWRGYSDADLRDLQVWQKLAWWDPLVMAEDARVRMLVDKGRGFSEEDKRLLREAELDLLRRVVPEYRAAAARGQIEISASPFYHPILPLLCDSDVYLRTHPQSRMPRQRFRHPEDARAQLERAARYHERTLGTRPVGLWPSEGSVSEAIVPLAAGAGFRWMATDELILSRSLGTTLTREVSRHLEQPDVLYRPYVIRSGGAELPCLFRDHELSDLIGFTYASWDPQAAAQDLLGRLAEAGRRFAARTGGEAVVTLILDGENAWEHYAGQGRPFLRAFYGGLSRHPDLTTVTMGEAAAGPATPLAELFPGSWINGDFYVWAGHPDDQRAWGQLADARQALEAPGPSASPADIERAREELLIAEGSDWFWWYGDDHASAHDLAFDDLFRRHLRNAYRALDKPVPEELFVTNITTKPPRTVVQPPSAELTPQLDGEVTSYFEWLGAGEIELGGPAGAMHRVAGPAVLTAFRFGFDTGHLHLRLDFSRPAGDFLADRGEVRLTFLAPERLRLVVAADTGTPVVRVLELRDADHWQVRADARPRVAAGRVLEVSIPLPVLGARADGPLSLWVALAHAGQELERHPAHGPLELTVPSADFRARHWSV